MKISNELKIGVLATVAIVLFIIGYNFLKGTDVFSSTDTFYARYAEVDGLGLSNFVKIKGLNVGRVTNLALGKGKKGQIVVEFTVNEDFKLPIGTVANIISSDLLGTKAINLELSDTSVYYKNGDTISSSLQESLSKSVQAELLPVKEKAQGDVERRGHGNRSGGRFFRTRCLTNCPGRSLSWSETTTWSFSFRPSSTSENSSVR